MLHIVSQASQTGERTQHTSSAWPDPRGRDREPGRAFQVGSDHLRLPARVPGLVHAHISHTKL